jgi:hypothetical protein
MRNSCRYLSEDPRERDHLGNLDERHHGFEHREGHVGFVVDEVTLEQAFSKYFGFLYPSHSTDGSIFISVLPSTPCNPDTDSVVKYKLKKSRNRHETDFEINLKSTGCELVS